MTKKGLAHSSGATAKGNEPRPRPPPPTPLPVSTVVGDAEAFWLQPGEVQDRVWDSRIQGFDARDPHAGAVVPATIPGFDE